MGTNPTPSHLEEQPRPSFTPGPWEPRDCTDNPRYPDFYISANRACVLQAGGFTTNRYGEHEVIPYLRVPNPADKALILAAPELYEACDTAIRFIEEFCDPESEQAKFLLPRVLADIRSAMAKASQSNKEDGKSNKEDGK